MIEPSLAIQTAIRQRLISQPAITDMVPAKHICAGSTRPEKFPTIIIGDNGIVAMQGRASGGQFVATVYTDIHVWALESGVDTVKLITAFVAMALVDWPDADGFAFDHFDQTRIVFPRDPNPGYGHGILSVEAVIRWKI